MKKWIGLSLGAVLGIGHIGMIGMLANRESKLPSVDIPIGDYTSYKVSVSEDGYAISYKANDPKTAFITKDIKEKGGFLGLANETTQITEEYFMDGQTNQGGAVSNHRSWLSGNPGLTQEEAANITAIRKSEECIKAIGSAEGTGRLVGTSVGAAAAPVVSSIPFVGWVAAGFVTMFGADKGGDIGADLSTSYAGCDDVDIPHTK